MNVYILIMVLTLHGSSVTTIEQQFDNEITCRAAMEKVKQDLTLTKVDVKSANCFKKFID